MSTCTPLTKRPPRKRTETRFRCTRLDPQATQTFSGGFSLLERRDFRGDEDVEDFTFLLPDDRAFCVDERPVIAEALDCLQSFAWVAFRASA
jgi:hypothetical protein